ncbi:murein biosynthesis integral membrane protein MurJ [Candidatus Falkowbacteria bacterium]|uniref:Probable lipid II flippase MurJ n=1 Tax=Candidatus Falkowbacteria bacterium CG10_big_fil_rev_8_21_14_0_10_37_18 TaxID=1974562 RepID=A0A2H0V841_9BACT|nr:murein biosynthesis integral membrane protein MurJ [Candidatus Falkowbacteria bacterium]NCQ12719.1 murein biosynthesis integral membrane protein MurJ [Candidatus Falkowbacteria bacterium]OIO05417.1 MAG: murein biosynthesis integral membrane protein MurJ [Candidatus Falkowbacteria bacterium CG1_02_37_21]PIR95238.1 MAG: murein biosynthesis integral membrane protein MurJ [Candidatus Falkowbacteria bacterium CG10_big_fil_rev_8_21_14_0_10_37_18]
MFRDIFKKPINSITVAAAFVALSSLASRFLGIVRDHILAGQFGAGSALDTYYAAFRIPDLIFNLIVLGALSAGFIPIFSAAIKNFSKTDSLNQAAWDLANNILNFLFLGIACLSLLGIIFAPVLTRFLTPGFGPQEQETTVLLTRIMFLSPLFMGLSSLWGGILQSFKRFVVYSLAPIFYNLGIIIGALYFVNWWGMPGLAIGVVLGAFLHMLVQIPTVYSLGFRYKFSLHWHDINTRLIGKMMLPRTMSLAISQINLVVITILASQLSSGSLSIFNFANNLQSFPIGIFGISFAIAAFPALATAAFDIEKLKISFSQTMRQILFFVIPASILIIVLRAQIVRVVLGNGNFDWQDTILTMNTLALFAVSLFAQATLPLLVRVFYARHNSATPFYVGLVSVVVNIALSLWLSPLFGVAGLAMAFSAANIVNFLLLWLWLQRKVGNLDFLHILLSTAKFIVAGLAAGITAQIMKVPVSSIVGMDRFIGVFTQLAISGLAGLAIYLVFCYLLQSEELSSFLSSIIRRWPFKKINTEDHGEARGV